MGADVPELIQSPEVIRPWHWHCESCIPSGLEDAGNSTALPPGGDDWDVGRGAGRPGG